jgi:hypothetical protein
MHAQRYWIEDGNMRLVPPGSAETAADDRQHFDRGHVRITAGSSGTEIKWNVMSPCIASLFVAKEWLRSCNTPCVLRFYASGWFEEFHEDSARACLRIEDTIMRGDRHVSSKIFIQEVKPNSNNLTPLLAESLNNPEAVKDFAVECVLEENTGEFLVETVGPRSAVAKIYGTFLHSYACQSASSYSQTVSEAYSEVVASGRPRYDHVLAAMRMPNNEVFWVPYRRMVLPRHDIVKPGVRVISEITPVDIQLI